MMDMSQFSKLDLAEGKDFLVRYRERWDETEEWHYGTIIFEWDFELWDHIWTWDLDEGQTIEILAWVPVDSLVFYMQDDGTMEKEYLINTRL